MGTCGRCGVGYVNTPGACLPPPPNPRECEKVVRLCFQHSTIRDAGSREPTSLRERVVRQHSRVCERGSRAKNKSVNKLHTISFRGPGSRGEEGWRRGRKEPTATPMYTRKSQITFSSIVSRNIALRIIRGRGNEYERLGGSLYPLSVSQDMLRR